MFNQTKQWQKIFIRITQTINQRKNRVSKMNRNGYFHFISVSCCSFFNLPFFFLKFFYFTTKKKIDHTFTKMHSFSIQILCCFFSAKNRPVISYRMPTTTSKQRNGKYIAIDWFLILIFFLFFFILQPKLKIKIESNPSRFDPSNVIKKKKFWSFFFFSAHSIGL